MPLEDPEGTTTAVRAGLKSAQDVAWLLLVVFTPLLVNLWGQQPFELPKVLLVRTLVWLLAALILAEYVLGGRSPWRRLRANPILGPLCLLALVIVVTTATSANRDLSLWGSYERGQGAVTLLTYGLLFWLAADRMQGQAVARRLLAAMAAAAAPLILLGLLQALGWIPFGLISDARSPIFATLGRANFLGAYLALLSPLTLAMLLTARRQRVRVAWLALLLGQLAVTGLTLARGAWLAMAVSLFLFALLWWGPQLARHWRRLAWSGLGLLFLSGPLAVLWLGRQQSGSAAARLSIWQGTLELIERRPLLGYGADSLGLVFPGVSPPDLVYSLGRQFFVDRAHNLFLDWAVTAGLPGLLAFLLLLVTFVLVVGRALRRPGSTEKRALLIAVLASVLGNAANNLVSFDVTPTATATWLLMGVGLGLVAPSPPDTRTTVARPSLARTVLVGFLLLGLITAVWHVNARSLLADVAARSAQRFAQRGHWAEAIAAAERAVERWPREPAHQLLLSRAYWGQAAADTARAHEWLPRADAALQAARRLRPDDSALWLYAAEFYMASARQFDSKTRSLAHNAYGQALLLAPNQATIYTAWGRAYLQDGDAQAAAPLLREAVRLDASNGQAYVYLGAAELALGRLQVALADYHEAVRLIPESSQAYAGLAHCYWLLERHEEALLAAEKALQRDPQNAQAMAVRGEATP